LWRVRGIIPPFKIRVFYLLRFGGAFFLVLSGKKKLVLSGKKRPRPSRGFKMTFQRARPAVITAGRTTYDARFRRSGSIER
jgi:hypothetical protein